MHRRVLGGSAKYEGGIASISRETKTGSGFTTVSHVARGVCVCVCVCCVCVQTCVCVGVCVCSVSICAALTYMLLGAPGGAVSRRAGGPGSGAAVAVTVGHRVAVSFRLPVSREFAVLMSEVNIYIRYPES